MWYKSLSSLIQVFWQRRYVTSVTLITTKGYFNASILLQQKPSLSKKFVWTSFSRFIITL